MTRPSFQDYGTYDESAHSDLWDGVVGYWAPCLGPTGTRLFDVSRFNNWGTLRNMDAATDWVIGGGQYALDFDGVNDFVETTKGDYGLVGAYAVSAWVYRTTTPSTGIEVLINNHRISGALVSGFDLRMYTDAGVQKIGLVGSNGTTGELGTDINYTWTLSQWTHILFTRFAGTNRFYANGVASGTPTLASDLTGSTAKALRIGSFGLFGANDLGRYFAGRVAEVVIHNRGLSPSDAARLYNLGRGGMLERRRRRRVYSVQADVVRSYLFLNRGQVIGGGTL